MAKYPPVQYGDYLRVSDLLSLQHPRSEMYQKPAHDEMLFIIVHQVYELWFKQILTELNSVLQSFTKPTLDESQLGTIVSRLTRITEIQKLLIDQVGIIETMTPLDFLDFRDYLYPASGFQSLQFRLIENKMGLKREQRLPLNAMKYTDYLREEDKAELLKTEQSPSLYELVERWLERTPFLALEGFNFWDMYRKAVHDLFERDREVIRKNTLLSAEDIERNLKEIALTEETFNALFDETKYEELRKQGHWRLSYRALHAALLIQLYRDQPILHLPFRLLFLLQDIDELFTTWRYRHALMAQRMLGAKIGTGGSSGHRYLKAATDKHRVFSDFFNLTTFFIPRSALPALPKEVKTKLGFFYGTEK